jgi:RNA binding exosome subunit
LAVPHLSSKNPIAYLTVRVFSHATEDLEKVQTAIRNTLPEQIAAELTFTKTCLTGHHGNPIVLLEAKFTNKQALPSVLEKLGASLSSLDKEQLNAEMKLHIEKRNLYLRFDKQSAFMGTLKMGTMDPIHFKIHFKGRTPEEMMVISRKAGLLP